MFLSHILIPIFLTIYLCQTDPLWDPFFSEIGVGGVTPWEILGLYAVELQKHLYVDLQKHLYVALSRTHERKRDSDIKKKAAGHPLGEKTRAPLRGSCSCACAACSWM